MFFLYVILTTIILWSKQTILTCGIHYWFVFYLNDLFGNILVNCFLYSFLNPQSIGAVVLYTQNNLLLPTYGFQSIPTSLIVGLYNIHPPLLYVGIISFIYYFNKKFNLIQFNLLIIWIIIFFAFVLGGVWGLGNGVWGYFWVNDLIEVLLLGLSLLACYSFHIFKKEFILVTIMSILLCLCLYLLIIRIGVINTRHAFFDAKNLTSIIWSYSLYYFSILAVLPIVLINLLPLAGMLVFYLIVWQILKICKIHKSSVKIISFHLLIFSFLIFWLKYAEFNITFKNFYNNENLKNFFTGTNSYILETTLNLKTIDVGIFYSNSNTLLPIKQLHAAGVYTRYLFVYFLLWVIFL